MPPAFLRTASAVFAVFCFTFLQPEAQAQPPASASPAVAAGFQIADVHDSPHVNNTFMRGGNVVGNRYVFHQATLIDLISNAWNLNGDFILGGPSWLETNR